MSEQFGPYMQVGKLAEQMAAAYRADAGLQLAPLVSHFMEEVDVKISSDTFDHAGFLERIKLPLEAASFSAVNDRQIEFLEAVIAALADRLRTRGSPEPHDL